mmetsp:Transcript_17682/g.37562  ORF Transcript_17682/g.37562 Transcript_17682/m.37562 type:complete len:249 (-) Transcript_17682:809-1555(-)
MRPTSKRCAASASLPLFTRKSKRKRPLPPSADIATCEARIRREAPTSCASFAAFQQCSVSDPGRTQQWKASGSSMDAMGQSARRGTCSMPLPVTRMQVGAVAVAAASGELAGTASSVSMKAWPSSSPARASSAGAKTARPGVTISSAAISSAGSVAVFATSSCAAITLSDVSAASAAASSPPSSATGSAAPPRSSSRGGINSQTSDRVKKGNASSAPVTPPTSALLPSGCQQRAKFQRSCSGGRKKGH